MEMVVCEEMFRAGFCFPLHPFIKCLLDRYGLVPTQIHPNVWRKIFSFMIKCAKVGLELRMRALRSILAPKVGLSDKW